MSKHTAQWVKITIPDAEGSPKCIKFPPIYFYNRYVETCPFDSETILPEGTISVEWSKKEGRYKYLEHTRCPVCYTPVFRRPSPERIKQVEEDMKRKLGTTPTSLESVLS